jgi:probable rRNA maturation factor
VSVILDLQIACEAADIPSEKDIKTCLDCVFQDRQLGEQEITVRIVDIAESQQLNYQYRGKNNATNVLSFPFEAPPGISLDLLGDLVICAEIVKQEAKQQNKSEFHHWTHMLVHGTLHLLGFDHINNDDAERMEGLEISILHKLSIDDPYQNH